VKNDQAPVTRGFLFVGGWVDLGMIRYIAILLFIGLAWGQTTTIVVFDLENNGLQDSEVRILTDRLQSELVKVGGYTVVERKKIEKVFEEQKFQMSGCVEECLIEIGMLLGAKEIVIGSVGRFGSTYTISARLVNASSGEMIQSSDFDTDGSIDGLLKTGMQIIATELSGQETNRETEKEKVASIRETEKEKVASIKSNAVAASTNFTAHCILVGNISEKKDSQGNIIFEGEIKNIGGRRIGFN
jgi:TolB-like protein